jgi:hypothetical protein
MIATKTVPGPVTRRIWNAETQSFDGALLRQAIVMRGWSGVSEFAQANGIRESTVYAAVAEHSVRDRTALRIIQALAKRDPIPMPLVG